MTDPRWGDIGPDKKKEIIRGLFGVPEDHPEKLDIADGEIRFKIRQQDGQFTPMSIADTLANRQFVQWLQIHD